MDKFLLSECLEKYSMESLTAYCAEYGVEVKKGDDQKILTRELAEALQEEWSGGRVPALRTSR